MYAIAWDRCTGFAAGWCGAIFGMIGGIVTWLVSQPACSRGKPPTACEAKVIKFEDNSTLG